MTDFHLVEADSTTLQGTGSYCLRSKKDSNGYINKNKWLNDRFEEGLRYVQLFVDKKQVGFVEYTKSESSSRVVHADNYMVIHCLWVSETGKGYGTQLINKCMEDAKKLSMQGIAVVTNPETSWTPSKEIFLKRGFQQVDTAPYGFELLALPFKNESSLPFFPHNWEERLSKFQELTILRSFQCPYVEIATENIIAGAAKLGIDVKIVDLKDREELMDLSPTPYGIFAVIYKGQLISFHRLTVHSVIKRLKEIK
jgi:L-amino acid N-acyltransferase YncA